MPEDPAAPAIPFSIVAEVVASAIQTLYARDATLLEHDVNERSVTHWLASHLYEELHRRGQEWHVDCEYNRQGPTGDDAKRLHAVCQGGAVQNNDMRGTTVFPDIIVHQRGPQGPNAIVIEVKKEENGAEDCDVVKLEAFTRELGYSFGVFLRFGERQCTVAKVFSRGELDPLLTKQIKERLGVR